MSVYQRGQAINLVNRFWTIDPLTTFGTLANPSTVTFEVLDPNNVTTTYVYGVDGNVTNPSVGIFVCTLTPPLPTGTYRYRCEGTGKVDAASEDFFDIEASGVLSPAGPNVAVSGPCSSWINGDDVAAGGFDVKSGVGIDHFLLDDVAYDASSLLYEASGRQFPGVCTRTVRPGTDPAAGFGWAPSLGLGPWYWVSAGSWGSVGPGGTATWYWINETGDTYNCGLLSTVPLGGYPVREILAVKIDNVAIPEFDPDLGYRNWRLDNRRDLVRMSIPNGDNPTPRWWPACQDLSLDDDQPGTFSVQYTWGADVPNLGRQAAAQLARELWNAENNQPCQLPNKVTKITRQGITMDRVVAMADQIRAGATGLQLVDAFIAMVNPTKMRRRPAVYSPDVRQLSRKVGQ